MNRLVLLAVCVLLYWSCGRKQRIPFIPSTPPHHTISILPLGEVDKKLVHDIKKGLQEAINADITILPAKSLPAVAFYKPRQRYIADSLLIFLKEENNEQAEKIIGITIKDISTRKDLHANWGVMGLGYCPGESCVISSFRAVKKSKSNAHFVKRMIILAKHELGHTYSLPHCTSESCLMKDAEGKMNLDNSDTYCSSCSHFLRGRGILR
jgi:archaemetzincin